MRSKFLTPFFNRAKAKSNEEKISTNPNYGFDKEFGIFTGFLLIVFISLTIIYIDLPWCILRRVRQYSGDLYQRTWNHILDIFGDDLFTLFVYGSNLLLNGLYWAVGLIYVLMDITGIPQCIKRYKIQPGTNDPLDSKRLKAVIRQVLFNQIIVGLPFAYVGYLVMDMCGSIPSDIRQLPSLEKIILDLIVCVLCREVAFYYSHRLLHHRLLYKYIHKRHHEWQSPIAITAIYCHPIEHILTNMTPPMLGPTLMGSHLSIIWIWFSYVILLTLSDHSGYHLPGVPSPEAHDFHHLKTTQCFGLLGLLDYLHGTDKIFRSAPAYKRHRTLLKMESVRSLVPD